MRPPPRVVPEVPDEDEQKPVATLASKGLARALTPLDVTMGVETDDDDLPLVSPELSTPELKQSILKNTYVGSNPSAAKYAF